MIVKPYKRHPKPPRVALLTPNLRVIGEDGILDLDTLDPDTRVWALWDTVRELVRDGHGEALCWNGEELKWRHERHPEEVDWVKRRNDVTVLKLPVDDEIDSDQLLRGLVGWRDWLAEYRAAPGTTGYAALSLLQATVDREIRTNAGERPPIAQTMGGRQELGVHGAGEFPGPLTHIDMQAAYARELGAARYGGSWVRRGAASDPFCSKPPEWWAQDDRLVYVRARVRVPHGLPWGPLPKRPRKRVRAAGQMALLFHTDYPTGVELQGVWCWQELAAAIRFGVKVEKVIEVWAHLGGEYVFSDWLAAVERGRVLPGVTGLLAKMTGNAMVGRFMLDVRNQDLRSIRWRDTKRRHASQRRLPRRPAPWPAHDLAEQVTGRVRARLWTQMMENPGRMVSAHTDGLWVQGRVAEPPDGWRIDKVARRLQLLDPQILRWTDTKGRENVVMSGTPAREAAAEFDRQWQEAGFAS